MNSKFIAFSAATAVGLAAFAGTAVARDQVKVAGSSTVLPYANIVAERFGKKYAGKFKTPIVESGGSSAGLKQFCKGVGVDTIDVANASRQIKEKEVKACAANGVTDIIEVKFGYDGIVFAVDKSFNGDGTAVAMTTKDLYLALGAEVVKDGKLVPNTAKTWKEVNPDLPDFPIKAFIPGEKHGTREVFEKKVIGAGCKEAGARDLQIAKAEAAGAKKPKKAGKKACMKVRSDGVAVDIDGDYTETLARIDSDKKAVGVFGLSFYENNTDKLKVATVNGKSPSLETVASGEYPVSRPLFFYIKKAHLGVIPGLKEYGEFFTSTKILDGDGPLVEYGLVPLPANELKEVQETVTGAKTLAAK